MNKEKIRGLVFSKYKTIREFSNAIGWQRNKSSRILNGIQEPDSGDMRAIAELFELSSEDFFDIFFEKRFTKCTIAERNSRNRI